MKKKGFAAILAAFFTFNTQAGTVGLYLGGYIWQSEANGELGGENTQIDFKLNKEQPINYFVAIEHPFPLFPNARISSSKFDISGKIKSTKEFNFGGEAFPTEVVIEVPDDEFIIGIDFNAEHDVSVNVSYVDYTLYYELFDNGFFSFDLGITMRDIDGAVAVTGTSNAIATTDVEDHPGHTPDHTGSIITGTATATGKMQINEVEPMLYVATNISLPLKGLDLFAKSEYSLKSAHSLYNYQIGLDYDLVNNRLVDFNLNLGYRFERMEFDNLDSAFAGIKFEGAFVGVIAHF